MEVTAVLFLVIIRVSGLDLGVAFYCFYVFSALSDNKVLVNFARIWTTRPITNLAHYNQTLTSFISYLLHIFSLGGTLGLIIWDLVPLLYANTPMPNSIPLEAIDLIAIVNC